MRVASFVVVAGIAAACGGASETNLFDDVPNSVASSSASSSGVGSSGAGSSGAGSSGVGSSSSSGASSSGQTSSSSSSSSSSGIVPFDAGPDIRVCHVGSANACRPSEYCHAEACAGTGVCEPRPTQTSPNLTPVCGCDHVTYWNSTIAASRGMNIAATGECGATGTTCTRTTGCAGEARCNLAQPIVCSLTDVKGTCWSLPRSCDGTNGGSVRRCSGPQCVSLCTAIADQRQFLPGTGCP